LLLLFLKNILRMLVLSVVNNNAQKYLAAGLQLLPFDHMGKLTLTRNVP